MNGNDKKTILIVDDSEEIHLLIKFILKDYTILFEEAYDGKEALSILINHTVDLIVMDMEMPFLNGIQTVTEIRKMEKSRNLKRIPVMFLSANFTDIEKKCALESGGDVYIEKPIIRSIFLKNIQEMLQLPVP